MSLRFKFTCLRFAHMMCVCHNVSPSTNLLGTSLCSDSHVGMLVSSGHSNIIVECQNNLEVPIFNFNVNLISISYLWGSYSSSALSETMILENLNGSSAIRTEYTGHKTKGKHSCVPPRHHVDFTYVSYLLFVL